MSELYNLHFLLLPRVSKFQGGAGGLVFLCAYFAGFAGLLDCITSYNRKENISNHITDQCWVSLSVLTKVMARAMAMFLAWAAVKLGKYLEQQNKNLDNSNHITLSVLAFLFLSKVATLTQNNSLCQISYFCFTTLGT